MKMMHGSINIRLYQICLNISCESAVKGYEDSCRFLSNIFIRMSDVECVIILSVSSDCHMCYNHHCLFLLPHFTMSRRFEREFLTNVTFMRGGILH